MKRRSDLPARWLWLLVSLWGSIASAAVTARLDRDRVASNDTVQLVLEHEGRPSAQPDLTPLRRDFEVVSSSRSSRMQLTNGEMTAQVTLQLTLSPKRTGALRIPSITWGNEATAPLALTVTDPANAPTEGVSAPKVFLETTVDPPQPYVQAAVNVTVRVFSSEPLYQGSLDLPAGSDALVQQVGKDAIETATRDGRTYRVIERRYVLFPQHSGELKLPGAVLNAQIVVRDRQDPFGDDPFNDLFGPSGGMLTRAQSIRVKGDPIKLTVAPRPVDAGASYWLPAQDVSVEATWQPQATSPRARVGEPLTLEVRLQAEGLTAAQLPEVTAWWPLPPGLKAYPDQAKLDNRTQGTSIIGTRTQRIALIADQPGELTLPEIRVQWWDTAANQARESVVPAQRITILPGAPGIDATASAAPSAPAGRRPSAATPPPRANAAPAASEPFWMWLSLALAVLWGATLGAWGWSRRGAQARPSARASSATAEAAASATLARRAFLDACQRNDPRAARAELLAWVAAAWPTQTSRGLRAVARQLQNARLTQLLLDLDRACYAGGHWDGKELGAALTALPELAQEPTRREVLQPLYP